MRKVLILGIGNILQSDEGLGVYAVNHIAQSDIQLPDGVELIDGGTAGFDLLPVMKGQDKIVIVDAIKVDDSPGSVYRFKPDNARGRRAFFSLHEVGIMEVISMLRILGEEPEIEIVGIVPEDINTLNIGISHSVRKSIPDAVDQVLDAAIN